MKRSRHILLGTVLSVSLALTACSSSNEEEEERFYTGTHSGIIYNHLGVPHIIGTGNSVTPMTPDHPKYAAAAAEGQSVSKSAASSGSHMYVSRGGFGSSSGMHVSS